MKQYDNIYCSLCPSVIFTCLLMSRVFLCLSLTVSWGRPELQACDVGTAAPHFLQSSGISLIMMVMSLVLIFFQYLLFANTKVCSISSALVNKKSSILSQVLQCFHFLALYIPLHFSSLA